MASAVYEFDAIGTRWWLELLDDSRWTLEVQRTIDDYVDQFTQQYSRFIDDSLIMQLQATGRLERPSGELRQMLDFAREMYDASDGVFNLSVGSTLHAKGYGDTRHGGTAIADLWDHVSYDAKQLTIPVGTVLDFGGFGKGWLIDRVVDIMQQHGYRQFIVNGGGDLYVAADEPVTIALEHPLVADRQLGSLELKHAALAASSTLKRTWTHDGATHHHIIDPTTEASSQSQVVASFVAGPSALLADTIATIVIIRPDLAERLEQRYGVQVMMMTNQQLVA